MRQRVVRKRHGWFAGATALCFLLAGGPLPAKDDEPSAPFQIALELAQKALAQGKLDEAGHQIGRALERDAQSIGAWTLRAQVAKARKDFDDQLYSLHKRLGLMIAQKVPKRDIAAAKQALVQLDPNSGRLLDMSRLFMGQLLALAKEYEKAKRPHAAIRTYQELLALAPDSVEAQEAIERISAAPDPSLAETAKPKDLLEDVSEEWIREHDAKHNTWDERAKLERDNYVTYTDAGYAVLVRCAEAMEQMNAFYRKFFRYGYDDGKSVPRIALNIFREKDTYLNKGIGPPVEWSKGHFTGNAVETWIGNSGFDSMVTTLFHEAAHQFVSLATNAVGWLNEGLACFFEGCRIQPNGTVLMNMPANGRLFGLATRMEKGWMKDAADGINKDKPSDSRPTKAPTFRIIIENEYQWGPPWYAPTWGVAYFLYNFQDPADGRFIYRDAFQVFIDASGGKRGPTAVENFEEVVLANPKKPTKTLSPETPPITDLPKTSEALDVVWKRWILALRDEQSGKSKTNKPYLQWAKYAIDRKDHAEATEHFEKGLVESPRDVALLEAFAEHLEKRERNRDRGAKLLLQAIRVVESTRPVNAQRVAKLESKLGKLDGKFESAKRLHAKLFQEAHGVAKAYLDANLNLMAMHVSWRLATDLRLTGLMPIFEEAVRRTGKSLSLWQLAYNEHDLKGWSTNGSRVFEPYGTLLRSRFGVYEPGRADYTFLTLDTVTSGDFSFESEILAKQKESGFAGLVFGRKGGAAFHCVIFFPDGYVDLVSFYGAGIFKTWRHSPVKKAKAGAGDPWRTLRIDVSGKTLDLWTDGELVVSHEFTSREVLQGSFGLITGPGTAQFRNVRYLARPSNDLAGAIERKIRMEELGDAVTQTGSYMGQVPPWPTSIGWLGEPAKSWFEKGYVPTLFVMWSIKQNNQMPIAPLLHDVLEKYERSGLRLVSVIENDQRGLIEAYVREHKFPGSVAIDHFDPRKGGAGTTMDRYFIGKRFKYPRMLLLDINQKVIWEGSPGLSANQPWKIGERTYLHDPLEELIEKRGLNELPGWIDAWTNGGYADVREGAIAKRAGLLKRASKLPADIVPEVKHAQKLLAAIQKMLAQVPDLAPQIKRKRAEPAWATLEQLAQDLDVTFGEDVQRLVASGQKTSRARGWTILRKRIDEALGKLDAGEDLTKALKPVLSKATANKGLFPGQLGEELEGALASNDATMVRHLLEDAGERPAKWLAKEFLNIR